MANKKMKELREVEKEFDEKISERKRKDAMAKVSSRIISIISKHLIKDTGYSVATTILQRELRRMGREDAKNIIDLFNLKREDFKDASKALKIAAMFLGLRLDVVENETVVRECPQGMEAIKLREPLLCNICLEYNNGIIQEMLGDGFFLDRTKWIFKGDEYCWFQIKKR